MNDIVSSIIYDVEEILDLRSREICRPSHYEKETKIIVNIKSQLQYIKRDINIISRPTYYFY